MAQLRAHLYKAFSYIDPVTGAKLPVIGATVKVCTPNTTNLIAEQLYSDDSSSSTLANPLITRSDGTIEAYVLDAQTVDLIVSGSGLVQTTYRSQFDAYNSGP